MTRHCASQAPDLPQVMSPVDTVKSSPLCRTQRTENRVIDQLEIASKSLFAALNGVIHARNIIPDGAEHSITRPALGQSRRWRLPPVRQVSNPGNQKSAQAVLECCLSRRRLPRLQTAIEHPLCAGIGEREMLENLPDTPLPFRMPCKTLRAQTLGALRNLVRQSFNQWIHLGPPARLI